MNFGIEQAAHVVGTTGKLLAVPLLLVVLPGPALGLVAVPLLLLRETAIVKGFVRGSRIDVEAVAVAAAVSDIVDVIAAVAANVVSEVAVAIAVGT